MKDIPQWQYELICENLGVSPYCEYDDEILDVRSFELGDILVDITEKFKEENDNGS